MSEKRDGGREVLDGWSITFFPSWNGMQWRFSPFFTLSPVVVWLDLKKKTEILLNGARVNAQKATTEDGEEV